MTVKPLTARLGIRNLPFSSREQPFQAESQAPGVHPGTWRRCKQPPKRLKGTHSS
jgi:hypothetical protein